MNSLTQAGSTPNSYTVSHNGAGDLTTLMAPNGGQQTWSYDARPAVIISNDIGNEFSTRVIVAPLTAAGQDKVYPFEVLIPAGEGGLPYPSKAALDQIHTVDKLRLGRHIGTLPPARTDEINQAIRRSLAV